MNHFKISPGEGGGWSRGEWQYGGGGGGGVVNGRDPRWHQGQGSGYGGGGGGEHYSDGLEGVILVEVGPL